MNRCAFALFLLLTAVPALAGPNSGGTLVVHDVGILYCDDETGYPSDPPASCTAVDNELPIGPPPPWHVGYIWKVYAAFPDGSSPRLKAFVMGSSFPDHVYVMAAGLPDPVIDFEIPQDGWPTQSGGGVGISFGTAKTTQIAECYWFGGYCYQQPGLFSLAPHPVQQMIFVDDSTPPIVDEIAGLSSLGFGMPGTTICPSNLVGACCGVQGDCVTISEEECAAACGFWIGLGYPCDPNPCPYGGPYGACCFPNGVCDLTWEFPCGESGGWFIGGCCDPNPCTDFGACCYGPDCEVQTESWCLSNGGVYLGGFCEPGICATPIEATTWGRLKQTYR